MTGSPVRVAYVMGGDIRPYRVPFLRRLAAREGMELTVYAGQAPPRFGAPEEEPDVDVAVEPVRNWFWPGNSGRVAWQSGLLSVLRSSHDVIVCSEIVSNLTVWAIRLLHRLFGKQLVLIGYFYRPQHEFRFRRIRGALRRLLRSSAGALIPYTDRGGRECLEEGVPAEKIFVMRNTLDTEALMAMADDVSDEEAGRAREEIGARPDQPVIAFLGRLRRVKRLDLLIEAMRILSGEDRTEPALVVIGDGPERTELEQQAEGLPVRFLGSIYEERQIAPYLAISQLMVLPGQVGLTCVHGFASGLPCLTTSDSVVTQSPEYEYLDDTNSVVLSRLDPAELAEAIRSLLSDPPRLEELARGARLSAGRLTMGAMADAFSEAVFAAAGRNFDAGSE